VRTAIVLTALCSVAMAQDGHHFAWLTTPYTPRRVPAVNFNNSPRIETLLRAGTLYVSLQDAIALAIENNLDVEFERFAPGISATDVLRAEGGGTLRGISLTVSEIAPGIGGPASPLLNAAASGSLPGTSVQSNLTVLNAITSSTSGIGITGAEALSAGPAIPQFDPIVTASLMLQHQNMPQVDGASSGGNTSTSASLTGSLGVTKGFSTGTQLSMGYNAESQRTNSSIASLNPNTSSSLNVSLTQPLLRGFGIGMNRRFIRIAKNNQKTTDQVFRQQLIVTVAGVIRLYDDFVSLGEDVKVKEETLALAERLYQDNKVQVEQGTLAPVELTRAQAEVAAARQDLANSRGNLRQQELILKTVLTRRGTADPMIRDAHLQPTTPIEVPTQEPMQVSADLVTQALRGRPEMEEARLQIVNSHIALEGSRNELLPELDLVATGQNSALAGQPNTLTDTSSIPRGTPPANSTGGVGSDLSQIATGRYPSYSVGVQLSLPVRNRVAQADVARDEMQIRQWDVRKQQLENQIRLEVEGAVIALAQARAAYDAAVEARTLQEQSLNIEMEKYSVGLSTTFLVMQYQSYLAQARSTEVAARDVYAKARVQLERAVGSTLDNNGIAVDQALHGKGGR
jgi:outer membrane protein